ncbi:MAG TPA: porin [Candidatus Acidoferrales bacterium]|nr:porin [Candidatus Acidoferrales bacterium]
MKSLLRNASGVATGILALSLSLCLAPLGQAQSAMQSPADSSAASASAAPAKSTQQQLDDLQKEMEALQQQIAVLKASQNAAPSVQNASYVQVPAVAPAADASKVTLAGLLGPTTLSGVIDTYYGYNNDHPFSNFSGLRPFDGFTNGFGLNMAELIVDKAPDSSTTDSRFGYHVSAGYGQAAYIVNLSDNLTDRSNFYIKEAYGEYLAPIGKGLTINVGKFVTPIGNEVIETSGNWNYSRSILFYYAIPFDHFGASAKYVFNPKVSFTGYLVNGWNNTVISHQSGLGYSSGLTYGGSLALTPNAKWSVIENYMAGPVIDAYPTSTSTINDWKQITDTVISYAPNAKWAFAVNGDYGFGPQPWSCNVTCVKAGPLSKWWGAAGYAKYTIGPKSYFALRYEYYEDPQDYTGLGANHAQEATSTYSYNLTGGLQVRGEYRYDFASSPIFQKGGNDFVKEQSTATLGFIYSFSSANAR